MNMISEIHTQFENPSAKTRPQSIVHAFNRLLKHKAQQGPEGSWQHPAGTGELADDLRGGLRTLRDLGFGSATTASASSAILWHYTPDLVPEPSSFLGLGMLVTPLIAFRRRRSVH